jgi:hypothetical protein
MNHRYDVELFPINQVGIIVKGKESSVLDCNGTTVITKEESGAYP